MPPPVPAPPGAAHPAVRVLRLVVAWVLGLVLLLGTGTALGVALYPTVTGGQALAVLSGSMTPGLPVGGMVFTREVAPGDVGVGDVITFQHPADPATLVTHRVTAVDTASGAPVFTTKGDANEDPDAAPVQAAAVQGRLWFAVPEVGRMTALLHSPKGVGVLVVLVCAVVAAHPGARPEDGEPATPAPREDVDADSARTVVMAPVVDERHTVLAGTARPSVPVPPPLARLLD